MSESQQLLADYAKTGSEAAFRELADRYINLVYSAAIRLVNNDSHLAEDVAQTVFADLARAARTLSSDVMIGGWLHRHTCFVARNTMRGEWRRQKRERQAVDMNPVEDDTNLASVAPALDDAINELATEDRKAILLRFFEQHDFRSVGEALGSSEEAARKRVNRALDKLHLLLTRRGVAFPAAALATALGAQAVTAAPVGMAAVVATSALAGADTSTTTALTLLQFMTMTKAKIAVVTVVVAAGVAVPWAIHHRAQSNLRAANESLRRQAAEIEQLRIEQQRLASLAAGPNTSAPVPATNKQVPELLKLRGEVARLRQNESEAAAAAKTPKPSMLTGLLENDPGARKLIRDQQKMGMGMIYNDFVKSAKLPKEQGDKFKDLLADHVMQNVDSLTTVLRDGKSAEEADRLFAAQQAALLADVEALLGPEQSVQYKDYTQNLLSHLTAQQFKDMMKADAALSQEQVKQLYQAVQEETQLAKTTAGLDPDFQMVPILNFRNIAFESEAEKSIQRLDEIYARVAARAASFLKPEQIQKFGEFRGVAISNSRTALAMNRKMMSPRSQ